MHEVLMAPLAYPLYHILDKTLNINLSNINFHMCTPLESMEDEKSIRYCIWIPANFQLVY